MEPAARPAASCLERVFDAGLLAFHGLGLFTVVVAVVTASPDPEVAPAFILAASAVISLGAAASLHRRWGHVGLGEVRYLLIGGVIWMAMAAASLYDPTVTAGTGLALLALANSLTSIDVGSTGSGGLSCGCFMMILLLVLQRLAQLLPPD